MAASQSAGRTAKFVNIGRNVVVASKSGPVETSVTGVKMRPPNFKILGPRCHRKIGTPGNLAPPCNLS